MKKIFKWTFIGIIIVLFGYLISVTIVDVHLMGLVQPLYSRHIEKNSFLIEDSTRTDLQEGFKCSAFSCAYLLRHRGINVHGDSIYEIMPNKMDNGYVYPKGIISFLERNNFTVGYYTGNIAALKNEIAKGNPAIVMIKIRSDKDWLHYVPVIGYSADSLFIAESIPELCNVKGKKYNRSISNKDFEVLWNTRAFKMPLYGNTFIIANR